MFLKLLKSNTQFRSALLTMILSLVTILSVFLAMFQVTAWFKNYLSVSTPAILTDFETKVEYSIDDGSWITLARNSFIPIQLSATPDSTATNGVKITHSNIKLRITYLGKSHAFVRFSTYSGFQNADTNTYLPQMEGVISVEGTDWVSQDGYLYYNGKVGNKHNPASPVGAYSSSSDLGTLNVILDTDKLSSVISPHQDYKGELYVHVDAVQPDRFQAFWGMNQLPFTLS